LFWRFATLLALVCLIGSDPTLSRLWTAQAACADIPINPNLVPEVRITTFAYDIGLDFEARGSTTGIITWRRR
jgi:hypothetical protein